MIKSERHMFKLLNSVLDYLTRKGNCSISAQDTHRYIDSDGWYEREYSLIAEDGLHEVYITTYSTYDVDFEDEHRDTYDDNLSPDDIYWNDSNDIYRSARVLSRIIDEDAFASMLSEAMRRRIKKSIHGYLEEKYE